MRAAVTLRNIVGKTQHLLVVATVPLHRYFNANIGILVALAVAQGVKNIRVENGFSLVDKVDKTAHAVSTRKIIFLAAALVFKTDAYPVVQETQLAQAFGQHVVMKIVVLLKNVGVGQKVHFGAPALGGTGYFHRRDLKPVDHFSQAVLHKAPAEFKHMHFFIATHRQPQHF
ncbi:hypothetical protein GALL_467970 [mine drainage metagenome]|uniref:Uncharacterized protein n=1 Tax=mine drainage metagenome TaxID=410659 RepID=A0A1J5PK94_9ZZZZ